MSQSMLNQVGRATATDTQWQSVCRMAGVAALIQLACVLITAIVASTLGAEPSTAEEYFTVLQNDRLVGLLRLDFTTLLLLALFAITPLGIYGALRRSHQAYAVLATALIYVGMLLALANHSAFSMIHLSDQYAATTSAAQRDQLLAAGAAVIASDMWHSTAGFLAGIFMQGAFVFISIVMLRSKAFSRATAYTGLVANGLDLIHVFVGLFASSVANILLAIGGLFYLAWFPLLGRDLLRVGRGGADEVVQSMRRS